MTLIEEYIKATDSEITKLERKVATGKCFSFEDYKVACAEIRAYRRCVENIQALYEKHYKSDED